MNEKIAPSLGQLARVGFQDANRALELLNEISHLDTQLLIDDLSRVADPDKGLLQFIRLNESDPKLILEMFQDARVRKTLLIILGASAGLSEYIIQYPADLKILFTDLAKSKTFDSTSFQEIAPAILKRADLVRANKKALLAIAAKDLASDWKFGQISAELSLLADLIVESALRLVKQTVANSEICEFSVLAMGKAGGKELNYVSDVDVIFIAEPIATADETAAISVGTQIATGLIDLISRVDQDGEIWQLDAALRPEGKSGSLVRTVSQHLSYYQQWAETWEFQALLKARHMAGSEALSEKYLNEITPLVWQAAERENFVTDVQKMRRRVEHHVDHKVGERELKLSSGGLRDVEFAVQLLQLVHGRSDVMVRSANTLEALAQLATYGYIGRDDGANFSHSYEFLRTLEHRIQLQQLKRTHVLPDRKSELQALGRSLGFFVESEVELDKAWRKHQRDVRRIHEKLFYRPLLNSVVKLDAASARLTPTAARERLEALGYLDPDSALRHLQSLTSGVSRRAQIQKTLLPILLDWFARSPEPDSALLAFRQISDQLGSTPWYLRLLRDESSAAERLSHVLGASRYATELLFKAPDAIGMFAEDQELQPRVADQFLSEQNAIINRYESGEEIVLAARALRRRELLRCATADLVGLLPVEEVGSYLSLVTKTTIEIALTAATKEVEKERNGENPTDICVIAMGRFGGMELGYGSDADVMFIHEPKKNSDLATAEKWAQDIANKLRSLLMAPSDDPALEIDADLRPEGKNGPLVRTLDSYLAYYQTWSSPWEAQALLRAIPIAGNLEIGRKFVQAINAVRYPVEGLSQEHLVEMRRLKARMESERLPRGADATLNLKLGRGGLSDVEWVIQLLQMQHGFKFKKLQETSTLAALAAAKECQLLSETDYETLKSAWIRATQIRNSIVLARNKATDQIPTQVSELKSLAFALGESSHAELLENYRKLTRRARGVMERLFYGEN